MQPIEVQAARAAQLGRSHIALTDHNTGAGLMDVQQAAKANGLAPIFGVRLSVASPLIYRDVVRADAAALAAEKSWAGADCGRVAESLAYATKLDPAAPFAYDITLLAQDDSGLRNLFDLLTALGTSNSDLLPQSDLLRHADGLFALVGGINSPFVRLTDPAFEPQPALSLVEDLRDVFGQRFYLDLPGNLSPQAATARERLVAFGTAHSLPFVATMDVHYLAEDEAAARDLLWAVNDGLRVDAKDRRRPASADAFPLSHADMLAHFEKLGLPDDEYHGVTNAGRIAAACTARIPSGTLIMPERLGELTSAKPPIGTETVRSLPQAGQRHRGGKEEDNGYLADVCRNNLTAKYGELSEAMRARLNTELEIITSTGFARYMLIVADIVQAARDLNILAAPRGSVAGSLVAYALGITPLNPLDYGLLFERFLNPARIAPPDIDLDIADDDRPRLLDWVVRTYGRERVAHISTHSVQGSRSALKDAAKAIGSDDALADRLSRAVPIEFQKPLSLSRCIVEAPEFRSLYENNPAARAIVDSALKIEGTGRNIGTHAAGIVITPQPVATYAPLIKTQGLAQQQRGSDEAGLIPVMTQWDLNGVEARGLLKIDLLGLTAWSTVAYSTALIAARTGHKPDVWRLPTDDPDTYATVARGETMGIFQLEGMGITEFAVGMHPHSVADLAFLSAAYRPGPMPFISRILAVRNGREPLTAPHPDLLPILAESYGAPVYQETMLKIAREVAGYSFGEADVLRKAIGKKDAHLLAENERAFTRGALAHGLSPQQAAQVWQMFPPFAYYGFNQGHAIVYGYVMYITAYLKTHYPLEYLCAMCVVAEGSSEDLNKAIGEARRLRLPLVGPDVNRSERGFVIDERENPPAIRFGLTAIKGLGRAAADVILAARAGVGVYSESQSRVGVEPDILDPVRLHDGDSGAMVSTPPFSGMHNFLVRLGLAAAALESRTLTAKTLTSLIRVGALPEVWGSRATLETALPALQTQAQATIDLLTGKGKSKKKGQASLFDTPPDPATRAQTVEALRDPVLPNTLDDPTRTRSEEIALLGARISPAPVDAARERLLSDGLIDTSLDRLPQWDAPDVRVMGMVSNGRKVNTRYGMMFSFVLDDGSGTADIAVFAKAQREAEAAGVSLAEGTILLVEARRNNQGNLTAQKIRAVS